MTHLGVAFIHLLSVFNYWLSIFFVIMHLWIFFTECLNQYTLYSMRAQKGYTKQVFILPLLASFLLWSQSSFFQLVFFIWQIQTPISNQKCTWCGFHPQTKMLLAICLLTTLCAVFWKPAAEQQVLKLLFLWIFLEVHLSKVRDRNMHATC